MVAVSAGSGVVYSFRISGLRVRRIGREFFASVVDQVNGIPTFAAETEEEDEGMDCKSERHRRPDE